MGGDAAMRGSSGAKPSSATKSGLVEEGRVFRFNMADFANACNSSSSGDPRSSQQQQQHQHRTLAGIKRSLTALRKSGEARVTLDTRPEAKCLCLVVKAHPENTFDVADRLASHCSQTEVSRLEKARAVHAIADAFAGGIPGSAV